MLIKSLELVNIRSYESQKVSFTSGTTLLSGDIGSGKSTILIGLEYALFGLLRGKMSPAELLRHGERQGSVSLAFEAQGHDVVITRTLKRSGDNIVQGAGTLVLDGVQESYVATELKAKVLELLGYPESLLSKSTNLFRYTVYTPQEHVKHILHESVEERKDIVRKIFALDRYKRVGENAAPYISDVRERISRLQGQTDDVKILKEQREQKQKELSVLEQDKVPLEKSFSKAQKDVERAKQAVDALAKKKEEYEHKKRQHLLGVQQIHNTQDIIARLQKDNQRLVKEVDAFNVKEVTYDNSLKTKIEASLQKIDEKKGLLNKKFGEVQAQLTQATKHGSSIQHLKECPTCKQEVSDTHKEAIQQEAKNLLEQAQQRKIKLEGVHTQLSEKEQQIRQRYKEVLEQEKLYYAYSQQHKEQAQRKKRLNELATELVAKTKQLKNLQAKQTEFKDTAIDDTKEKKTYESAVAIERQLALQRERLLTQIQSVQRTVQELNRALVEKDKIVKEITRLTMYKTWTQELFIPLVKTIEKRVLLSVYHEFNTHFINWFSQLIDDESLQVRLDEDFTPLIVQNGFDTGIENLSGGEKTSVALAYRLALTKVLNDYFSTLHTKGLLILDEPTDGFSTQQLDKLREVLSELGVAQVIIVSHEQRLENVADNILHVQKQNHTSSVI